MTSRPTGRIWYTVVQDSPTWLRRRPRWRWSAGKEYLDASYSGVCTNEDDAWKKAFEAAVLIKSIDLQNHSEYLAQQKANRYLM